MTTHATILLYTHDSSNKLKRLDSATDMPTVTSADPSLSVLSNSANSSQRDPSSVELPRKSHDKTISGVFTYSNGTDIETGYPEHRLDQFRASKSTSLHSLGTSGTGTAIGPIASTNLPNGILKTGNNLNGPVAGRSRSQSRADSIISTDSFTNTDRDAESSREITNVSRQHGMSDQLSKSQTIHHPINKAESTAPLTHEIVSPRRTAPELHRTQLDGARQSQHDSGTKADARTGNIIAEPVNARPTSHRLSSPPAVTASSGANADRTNEFSHSDPLRLAQRHTLQIPRSSGTITRESRDFSFSAGDETIVASGRFSPTRDNFESVPRHRRPSFGLIRRTTRSMASDAHLDEVPPDEDAARWTELVKQKRASRRKRREEEDDDRVIVGKKVEEGHVNWVTAYNMLTGIRFTVSRTNAKMDRELTDADFDAKHKFSFDVTGNELTPSAKYDFKFKDYSPWVFRRLRAIFGLDPADYLMSLTSKYILSELGSPGKSGSFFYFSRDYKYIIKTIHHAEHKLLRKVLRDYYAHVRDNPNTLISQFYGLHRVKIPYGRKIHFVVMNNLFPPHRDVHQTFDLKGSTIGRDFKEEDLESNPRATLKDLNWLRRDMHLEFQDSIKNSFIEQVKRDVSLLQKLHIMDYSLLVGMHDLEKGNEENVRETTLQVFQPGGERDEDDIGSLLMRTPSRLENARKARELRQTLKKEKPTPMSLAQTKMPDEMRPADKKIHKLFYSDDGGVRATHEDGTPGDQIYYLGVIDCLTHYGFVKRVEHFWKGLSSPSMQISPIPPEAYGERFINFITGITMTQEEAERRRTTEVDNRDSVDAHNMLHHHHIPQPLEINSEGIHSEEKQSPTSPTSASSPAVDRTMRRAQKEVDKTTPVGKTRRESEEELPDRTLRTVSVDGESHQQRNSTTLPVVQEVGEGGSDVSRSTSREKPPSSPEQGSVSRQVPASVTTQDTNEDQEKQSFDPLQITEELSTSPTTRYSEEARETVNNAFKPVPSEFHSQQYQTRDKPPRLGSGLIPRLAPMDVSTESMNSEGKDNDFDHLRGSDFNDPNTVGRAF